MFVFTRSMKYTMDYILNTKIDYIIDGMIYERHKGDKLNEIYNMIKEKYL